MHNHDLYEELEKKFSIDGEQISTTLGLLKKLAECLKETEIREWTEKELYGYKDGDSVFPPCRQLKVKEVATCCTPTGQSFKKTLSQDVDYTLLTGWLVLENSIVGSEIVLQQKPDVIGRLYPAPENDYRNVRVVADVQVVKKCESETRASAKQKFELICSKHSEIKKAPFTRLEIRGYIIGGIISLITGIVAGIVVSALNPTIPQWVAQFWKRPSALNAPMGPQSGIGGDTRDAPMQDINHSNIEGICPIEQATTPIHDTGEVKTR